MRRICVSIVLVVLLIGAVASSAEAAHPVSWVPLPTTVHPPAQSGAAMTYDPALGQTVLFGRGGTWTFDGATWTKKSPALSPQARSGAAMAYDYKRANLVLFGGWNGTRLADTWTYDGITWTQQAPATSPPARSGASVAYDYSHGGRLVLFGGYGDGGMLLADTWTYNGVTWTHETPAASPPARSNAAMAPDPPSNSMILFGGANGHDGTCQLSAFADTWVYDGSTWTEAATRFSPPALEGAVMVDDVVAGGIVLFGGHAAMESGNGCSVAPGFSNETWMFRVGEWTRVTPSIRPSARYRAAMAYDPQTSRLILFGGSNQDGALGDTWIFRLVGSGYRLVAADGGVFAFDARFRGSTGNLRLQQPIVGMAANPGTDGYWMAASDGGVFAFGAPFFGSLGGRPLAQPIVGMAAATDGEGYWLVSRDGEIFNFGPGARRHGAKGPLHLNRPIVGMAVDTQTGGYRLVASDGGVFTFDAPFRGSTGGMHLNQPIVGMAADAETGGYWLVASDGGVFAFGAPFYGSMGGRHLNQPIVGITAAPDGAGYWLVARDGGVFGFGPGASYHGSTGGIRLNQPVVGMAGS